MRNAKVHPRWFGVLFLDVRFGHRFEVRYAGRSLCEQRRGLVDNEEVVIFVKNTKRWLRRG
jgi:hypothetical protein